MAGKPKAASPAAADDPAYCKRRDKSAIDDGWVVLRREETEELHGNEGREEVKAYTETELLADVLVAFLTGKTGEFETDVWY